MNTVKVLDGQVEITFKKRTLLVLATMDKIESVVDPAGYDSDVFQIFASNFCLFMARTENIRLLTDTPDEIARDWVNFWEYAQGRSDYDSLFMAYISQCHESINNVWHNAYIQFEERDPLLNPPELRSPDRVPAEVLEDEDVKKSENLKDSA